MGLAIVHFFGKKKRLKVQSDHDEDDGFTEKKKKLSEFVDFEDVRDKVCQKKINRNKKKQKDAELILKHFLKN